jgi:hypothetical protein
MPKIVMPPISSTNASDVRKLLGKPNAVAEVSDQVTIPPTIQAEHGRAWLVDLNKSPQAEERPHATVATWLVEAPWAHPIWHSYLVCAIHLRPITDLKTIFYLDGATHEIWVFALEPDMERQRFMETRDTSLCCQMYPKQFAAQFIEPSDESACERVKKSVEMICRKELSPDVDAQNDWGKLYGYNMMKAEFKLS